ncbi:hypothetical protein PG999_010878 [Apiospora kogelbergensis]|uniref:BRCT domain-containing protein n=1 Tax=Apiospora kogelbergensis TaxID=1337665 RepID=A0AAW0QMK2_9PEZI
MSLVTPPKKIFGGVMLATTSHYVDPRGRTGWADVDIARYVKAWGGSFSFELNDSVTHLIALPQDLDAKPRSAQVTSALKRKKLNIVHLDWFEDSIIEGRKLNPKDFQLARNGRPLTELAEVKRLKAKKKTEKDNELAKKYVDPRLFHAYTDETFFTYEIVLTKGDMGERYCQTLFESNAEPHTYTVGRIYQVKKGARGNYERMRCPQAGTAFEAAFEEFVSFFEDKTGIAWNDRVVFRKGKGHVAGDRFVYELPTGGRPIGLIKGEVADNNAIDGDNDDSGASNTEELHGPKEENQDGNEKHDDEDSAMGLDDDDDHSGTGDGEDATNNAVSGNGEDEGYASM